MLVATIGVEKHFNALDAALADRHPHATQLHAIGEPICCLLLERPAHATGITCTVDGELVRQAFGEAGDGWT